MPATLAYAAKSPTTPLGPWSLERREPGAKDVQIEILYCGVCHSDLHAARGEWPGIVYPLVPGHEIVGKVTKVGREVTKFKVGDHAAVGCLVGSCRRCSACNDGLQQMCEKGAVFTYYSMDPDMPGQPTHGGYSKQIVVAEDFTLRVAGGPDLAAKAPLLCAGITTYSPLRHWKVGKGKKVGIVGLGGLGHMGVKLAHAMGAQTCLFTTSANKVEDGKRLGADEVIISRDEAQMSKHTGSFDFILNTVSAAHNLDVFTALLRRDSTMCLLGAPPTPHPSPNVMPLLFKRLSLAGSLIGGLAETQEMLDFCAAKGITADIEMIRMDQINEAYERMLKSDVKYRFVIDMGTLRG